MKYMGSKARIANELLPIILKDRKPNQYYVEPFVGGANMIDKVDGNRIGADINKYLIALFKEIQVNGAKRLDLDITEEKYNHIKNNFDKYELWEIAHCGFNSSFGAKWFGGYARPRDNGYDRDVICGANILEKQSLHLKGVDFFHSQYNNLFIPNNSIIYCDPPYIGTTGYKDSFSHSEFYSWVRIREDEGNQVFISEYTAPADFSCVWEGKVSNTLSKDSINKSAVEKLFTLNPRVKLPPKQPLLF